MKKKLFKYIKFLVSMALILSLVAPSYASLSASDGSAFVTKAEFDSALADFNARLTTFEAGINSKIDSQVTSYLDRNGIWSGKSQDLINAKKTAPSLLQLVKAGTGKVERWAVQMDTITSLKNGVYVYGNQLGLGKNWIQKFDIVKANKSGLLFGGLFVRDWVYGDSSQGWNDDNAGWMPYGWETSTTIKPGFWDGSKTLMDLFYTSGGVFSFSTIASSGKDISANRAYLALMHVVEIFNKTQNRSSWQMTVWSAAPDLLSYACGMTPLSNGYYGPGVGVNTAAVYGKPIAFVQKDDELEIQHYIVVGGRNFGQLAWVFGANAGTAAVPNAGLWTATQFDELLVY